MSDLQKTNEHPPKTSPHPQANELTAWTLAGFPFFELLLMNTARPKPSMNLPGDRYSMHSPNCNSSAIEFPNKLNFRSFDLALVYLSIWVENYVYVTAQTYII